MTRRALSLAALALIALALLVAPETRASSTAAAVSGWASAYAPGVFEDVVRHRFANDWWPVQPQLDWYIRAQGYIATNECRDVGRMATLIDPSGREWRVLIADCGERGKPGEGQDWMTRNRIIAELDWRLFERLTELHGKPLRIEVAR
jgi:hypothetical protein